MTYPLKRAFLFPVCAVCNRPVERLERLPLDPLRMVHTFRAYCHGDVETTVLTEETLMDGTIEPGIAFSTNRLENSSDK